tara:strand:- start:153 stop:1478 length:1326 start_codon:yes stop_codon:yes gene_type:complete
MFECSICGLLSLNAISCPACGSQNLKDLSATDLQSGDLPKEIPGLDDAAESWHDLEGSSKEENDSIHSSSLEPNNRSSLPFGFSGESNFQVSRLPFGIGSHADGIPFDNESNQGSVIDDEQPHLLDKQLDPMPQMELSETSLNRAEQDIQSFEPKEQMAEVVIKRNNPIRIQPLAKQSETTMPLSENETLPSDFDVLGDDIDEIPDEWRISASEANMDEIYSTGDEVVEVVHHYEEDVVVFDHQSNQSVNDQSFDLEESDILSLELHPARALDVNLLKNPECRDDLDAGFFAIAKNSWAEAAIKFQQIASRMPGDSAVYNNYGLALLQRAIEMAKDVDESIQILASSQFESAILALREAAKSDPDEPVILLNLAHALLVSGRSEKALKIINVHNSKHPNSVEGVNLEAATLVSLGQSVNAKTKLSQFRGDSIVEENLARLL